jgi:hypothetical protein
VRGSRLAGRKGRYVEAPSCLAISFASSLCAVCKVVRPRALAAHRGVRTPPCAREGGPASLFGFVEQS